MVGIDAGKFTCVVACHGQSGVFAFKPDAAGIADFLQYLGKLPGALWVGLEASGGDEAGLWARLEAAGVAVRQLAPAKVHASARSVGRRAKTDASDAVTSAAYMAANPMAGRQISQENVRQIRALAAAARCAMCSTWRLSAQAAMPQT